METFAVVHPLCTTVGLTDSEWRKILYERDYYGIFMLDLDGNCIYSVYVCGAC